MKQKHYRFFRNRRCEFFPCHETDNPRCFNCLMCYCPLYFIGDCGGNFRLLESGLKDCSSCTLPHFDYDAVLERLNAVFEEAKHGKPPSANTHKNEISP